ncbi:MAG TPA: hypothetical protein VGL94_05900 [Ktedonobacteraceae bacterium]
MFETVIAITVAISKTEDGQITFQVYERELPQPDLLSLLALTYYQDIYSLLLEEDVLTVTFRLPQGDYAITANFLASDEGPVFEEQGYAPTLDLFPRIKEVYLGIEDLLRNSEKALVLFHVKRV